jgi:prepilin-type N-terminal cleavage/methylation domain-containing protein
MKGCRRTGRTGRGFTLVEMLTVVAIVGLILMLIGVEIDASITGYTHDRANLDTESQSRLVMTKVVNRLRGASPWVFASAPSPGPTSSAPDPVILYPTPAPSPAATATSLTFYRPHPGSLSLATSIPLFNGVPDPPYDIVTIERAKCPTVGCTDPSPNYLVETAVDAASGAQSEQPLVLGTNVTAFSATAAGSVSPAMVTVEITVQNMAPGCHPAAPPPSPPPSCTYTAADSVWIGGDSPSANQ